LWPEFVSFLPFLNDDECVFEQVLAKLQIPWRCPFAITAVSSLEFRLVSLGQEMVSVSATGTELQVQHDQVVGKNQYFTHICTRDF
jgi:hypothetical protein